MEEISLDEAAEISKPVDNPGAFDDDHVLTPEEKAEIRRTKLKREMAAVDLSDVEEDLKGQVGNQRVRRMSDAALERVKDAHLPESERGRVSACQDGAGEIVPVDGAVEVVEDLGDPDPFHDEIQKVAERTPEVRFTKAHMLRAFNENELKIIAGALRTSVPLYRVADVLHCSVHKIENAIAAIPILSELAQEKIKRRKEQAQEAVDDCVKARVPAVVMWNAEKILPEIYGNQVNLDNEDDTKLVIGALSQEDLAEADAAVAAASSGIPQVEVGAVMEALQDERGAELAAAGGGGVPIDPLRSVPAAPALNPPQGDPRFRDFAPASEINRLPIMPQPPVSDPGPDNYCVVGGGGFDDYGADDGSWI